MKFIQGLDRNQATLFPSTLEQSIDQDNEVRIIDLFVDSLSLEDYGFRVVYVENGRPAYHPSELLKLYMYGYLNKTRTSRDLEKECKRNIEVIWLLKGLQPDHNTISNFRRDNPKAIKKVFRVTVQIAKHFDLIGGKLIAGDSTKLRAQNSKKNNFNQKKIAYHTAYIDNKLEEYNRKLSAADDDKKQLIEKEIKKHNKRKDKYKEIEKQLEDSGETQVSTSDPESRQMMIRNRISEVAYNVQTTVDEKNNLPIDYKVTDTNDSKAMGDMLRRAKSILRTNQFMALYDKGYHTGSELDAAERLGIETLVAVPAIPSSSQAPDTAYNVEHFKYSHESDTYTCPEGNTLRTNGTWHQGRNFKFRQYKTPACKTCVARAKCTKSVKNGKIVQRNEYISAIERNKERVKLKEDHYRRRQAIVEHPYGTIKRQWGFSYIITKKFKKRASADVGLMFTAYNLRRILNIIGKEALQEYFRELARYFSGLFHHISRHLILFGSSRFINENIKLILYHPLKRLKFDHSLILIEGC